MTTSARNEGEGPTGAPGFAGRAIAWVGLASALPWGARNATEVIAVVRAGQPATVGPATVIDRHNALAVKRVNE